MESKHVELEVPDLALLVLAASSRSHFSTLPPP